MAHGEREIEPAESQSSDAQPVIVEYTPWPPAWRQDRPDGNTEKLCANLQAVGCLAFVVAPAYRECALDPATAGRVRYRWLVPVKA